MHSIIISVEDLIFPLHTAVTAEDTCIPLVALLDSVTSLSFMFALKRFFALVAKTQVTESEHQLHHLSLPGIT